MNQKTRTRVISVALAVIVLVVIVLYSSSRGYFKSFRGTYIKHDGTYKAEGNAYPASNDSPGKVELKRDETSHPFSKRMDQLETKKKFQKYTSSLLKFHLTDKRSQLAMKLLDELENGKKIQEYNLDLLSQALTPVTAVSSNHYHELMKHIDRVHRFMPNKKLILFDLGLSQKEVLALKKLDFVEYRKFDFTVYPNHVTDLKKYAWKPLIIQQILAERGGVFWMDSSVVIKQNYTAMLQQVVKNQFGFLYYLTPNGHSIVAATHPNMFTYLPMSLEDKKRDMRQASGMLMFNTVEVRQHVMKWAILCCLYEDCIAPEGSTLHCNYNFPRDKFGGCHRYDQSMMSILVVNAANSGHKQYTLPKPDDFAVMERISSPSMFRFTPLTIIPCIILIFSFTFILYCFKTKAK